MMRESTPARVMNFAVSSYVYFVAFTLVVFMISSLVAGLVALISELMDIIASPAGLLEAAKQTPLELDLLHTIAFTIVLVKAYKILITYAQYSHVNLKYLVEIAIIAPTVELIFNSASYTLWVQILFAVLALSNLVIYLIFYKTLKLSHDDYEVECEQICKDRELEREEKRLASEERKLSRLDQKAEKRASKQLKKTPAKKKPKKSAKGKK